jgi:hypothetical protein
MYIFIKKYKVKLKSDVFSSTEYNTTLFESNLLISFSNKNCLTLLAELVRAGPMIVKICVSPGIEPCYIVFPSHKNNAYMFRKVYCYLCEKRKFVAVRRVGLMTHHEYRVDRLFPVT